MSASVEHDTSVAAAACDYCHLSLPDGARHGDEPAYCCFGCRLAAEITGQSGEQGALHWTMVRLGLAIFLSINVMMFTMALWTGEMHDARAGGAGALAASLADLFRYLCLVLSLPVLMLLGVPMLENAIHQRRSDAAAADLLILLGVGASYIYSAISVVRGAGHVYFEVGCTVLVMVTLGRWLEAHGKLKTTAALDALAKLIPQTVRRLDAQGVEVETPQADVRASDRLRVLAGERIAVDGQIESGTGTIDQQILTGESQPVTKTAGQTVLAGSLNLDGDLVVRATAAASAGTLARIVELVRQAGQRGGRYQRIAQRAARWFLRAIIVVAVATFAAHTWYQGFDAGLLNSLAVLLIACPCALGLATPMAVWTALGTAARCGIIMRSGESLERLAAIRAIRFDKTGTLTVPEPGIIDFGVESESERDEVLRRAAVLAQGSTHWSAKAIATFVHSWLADEADVAHGQSRPRVTTMPGRGVCAQFGSEVQPTLLGLPRWLEESGCRLGPGLRRRVDAAMAAGDSFSLIGWEGAARGFFTMSEALRPAAPAALHRCRQLGLDVAVLTGDNVARGARIGQQLDVALAAQMLPEDKVAALDLARRTFGPTAMVGDGINDAPALAASDVGIALGCGADVTREAGEICILDDDLASVPWIVELAQASVRIMRQNLFWAFGYNAVGVVLAAAGMLNPAFAAAAMVVSSSLVVGNSLRLSRLARPGETTSAHSDGETRRVEASVEREPVMLGA